MNPLRDDPHGRGVETPGILPPVRSDHPRIAQGRLLVRVDDLGARRVVEVDSRTHGVLAVGMTPSGVGFAVSNICRHQGAKLGRGRVTHAGCLECPWHRADFDIATGAMRSGPKGRVFGFRPYSAMVALFARRLRLRTHPVEVRDGGIYLLG